MRELDAVAGGLTSGDQSPLGGHQVLVRNSWFGQRSQTTTRAEMTTLEAREAAQPLAGEKLKGRVALVTGVTRGVGTAIGRSLAGRLGRRDGVHLLCADASSCIAGRVWALSNRREL